MNVKQTIFFVLLGVAGISWNGNAQIRNDDVYEYPEMNQQDIRNYINIPDIEGYKTLKCDFHIHTSFSDGKVWPNMRVDEAWNDGLDAIAITDHIEYRPNKDLIQSDLNKSYEIARKRGQDIEMIVIKGIEITRKKPLGHLNALFIQDANKLEVPDELEAINEALKQKAFILWNHPGWPNDTSTLYPVHKELIAQHKIHGVEVFNAWEMYPKVIDWCDEFKLAPFANSDLHNISASMYPGKFHRPMTLVFAKEYSEDAIKEAMFAGRTVACFNNNLVGKEEYLKALIQKSLFVKVINREKNVIEICNKSDIQYQIRFGKFMYSIPLNPCQVIRINIPSGTEVTFTNCFIGRNKFVVTSLW